MQIWTEIQVEVHNDVADLVAAALASLAGGVELRDAGTLLSTAPDRTCVVALCPPEKVQELLDAADEALSSAREAGVTVDPVIVRQRQAHEDEWRDVWKQFFCTTPVGKRFTVQPSWDQNTKPTGEFIIHLDPGMAFGTGAHPSTRLVVALAEEWRETRADVGRILDLGSGSGILSIVAAWLWPDSRGLALDIDPQATECAQENLERNHVTSFQVRTGALSDAEAGYDLIMANIQADVLATLALLFAEKLDSQGRLILSGILTEQVDSLLETYEDAGFSVEARREEGEWSALRLRLGG